MNLSLKVDTQSPSQLQITPQPHYHHTMSSPPPPPPTPTDPSPPPTLSTLLITYLTPDTYNAAQFTYNQPHLSNAFTLASYHDLATALRWAASHPLLTIILVTGAGKHYCAGKVMQSPSDGGPTIEQEIAAGGALGEVLRNFPKILVAGVNGAAIGWGCTQLWWFDLVYASEKAFFQTPFTRLGFVPEGGSSWSFLRQMGRHKAMRLLVGSERVGAVEMERCGWVTEVVEGEGWLEVVKGKCREIGGFSRESVLLVKELCRREEEVEEMKRAGEKERKALTKVLSGDTAMESMRAFGRRKKEGKL